MTCSPARLAANQRNSLLSTGPRTQAGKARSRCNALKHGLTGAGVVLPDEDAAEIDRRFEEFQDELNPAGGVGRHLARRAAMLSVRLDRCVRHEAAATASKMRRAGADFERERLAEVDAAMSWIASEPATQVRKLRSMPEGVDRMIAAFLDLRHELDEVGAARWDWTYGMRLVDLTGSRYGDMPVSRLRALSDAVGGDFQHLLAGDGDDLGPIQRRTWARDRLVERIDAEVAALRTHRETLDPEAVEEERAGAEARALFDPSKEAILARKYEAAAERGFFRTLRELREVEAASRAEDPDATPGLPEEGMGSSFPADEEPEPDEARQPAPPRNDLFQTRPHTPAGHPAERPRSLDGPGGGSA